MMIIGILLITNSQWAPPFDYQPIWVDPWYNLSMLIWPALATGYRYSAVAMRMTRSTVLEVLREDYIRTARAKGLVEKIIINRHALTNAMLPVITVIGIEFAFLMGGLVVTEQVFNLAGIGNLFVTAVELKDYVVVQALVLIVAFVFVFTNFFIDILYAWLDPRIRYA
jgi:peptide/nickel transport system permease protein